MERNSAQVGHRKFLGGFLFPLIAFTVLVGSVFPQQALAQSGSDLEPPQNVQRDEGEIVTFGVTVQDVALADIISVKVMATDNWGGPIAGLNNSAMTHVGTVAAGERYELQYFIPYDFLETYGHQNLKWYIAVTYTGGAFTAPGSGQHVIHVQEAVPPSLNVITEVTGGGSLPTGSGWDLTTTPAGFSGTPSSKDTGGLASGDDQSVSPAATGDYTVTGRSVSGYTISYGPQSGTLSSGGSLTLKVIYTRQTGTLTVETELAGGGTLPAGSGWDLTTKPGDFSGSPSSKDTGGLTSINSQGVSPAVTGNYGITGRAVTGYTISYSPQSGSLSSGGSLTLKVIYTRQTGTLTVETELTGGGNLPTGSGWDLTTKPGDFSGSPAGKNTTGLASVNSQGVSPAVTGSYGVTGRAVSGYTISYSPQSGSLSSGGSLTLKVIYTRDSGSLNVITEVVGGGNLPAGSGWDLTTKPGDFSGSPAGKNTGGLASGDNQSVSPAVTGSYAVTGRAVGGYTISYGPQSGTLSSGGTLTLKVIYVYVEAETLNVITELTGGGTLPAGSGWDLTTYPGGFSGTPTGKATGGLSSGDSQFIDPLVTGNYGITGRTVTGYSISYAPQSGSLSQGGNLTLKVIYTRDTGSLNVITELAGGGTLPTGSGWDLTTKPGDFSGSPASKDTGGLASGNNQGISPAVTGSYAVSGRAVSGYSISYSPQNGSLTKGGSLTLKVIYTRDSGNLNVITEVVGGGNLPTGSGWDLTTMPGDFAGSPASKDTSGLASGDNQGVSPAVAGDYAVAGRAVSGFTISYAPENGTLSNGGSLTLKVIYTRDTATLKVITEVAGGGNLPVGAGWSLNAKPGDYSGTSSKTYNSNEASPQNYTNNSAETGDYDVNGNSVAGYTVSVSPSGTEHLGTGETLEFTVTYTITSFAVNAVYWDPVSNSQVFGGTITPPNTFVPFGGSQNFVATVLPAGYRLTGGSAFTGTGSTSVNLATKTAMLSGVLSAGAERIYVELIPGELEVIILPESIRNLAGWHYKGQINWKLSWPNPQGTEELNAGFYDLEFKDVSGWNTPDPVKDVQVFTGKKTTVVVLYTQELAGALQVFITDNRDERVRDMGAQWRPTGKNLPPAITGKWYNHGDIITGLPVGGIGLQFKTINGAILPELTGTEIFSGKTTKETGGYWWMLHIHKSDYNGDGTDDLAVFNDKTRRWSVASISQPGNAAPAAFVLFEKKFGREDDIPTAGDYDGDGIADLSYWRESTGEWRVLKQFTLKNFGEKYDLPVPGDYNGDGRTDPALYRPSTGQWLIYDVDREKIIKISFGSFGDVPVPGNYDGDAAGMTDLAVFNAESQQWRVAFYDANKDKWIEKKKIKVNGKKIKLRVKYGAIGNVPVQADYDGNGTTDHAVYKRRASVWDIKDQYEIELGRYGDVPVPNDWAGLGRVIPTIFRVRNGQWLSVDNLLKTKHGQGGQPLMSGR